VRAIAAALDEANLKPEDISLILSGANSAVRHDRVEAAVINEAFGPHAARVTVNALKAQTGECLDASGTLQAIAAVLAINRQQLPPPVNCAEPDPAGALAEPPAGPAPGGVRHVLITASSFTGNSSALVISQIT
jgi:3-oxoacyl-[acyl-carrier-protein] synthase II